MNAVATFTPSRRPRRLPATTEPLTGARLIRGPWRMVFAWSSTPWGRGSGRRLAPDRAEQLELDLQPAAAASVYGFTLIESARPSRSAGDSGGRISPKRRISP